jgi:hypothetical protein
MRTREKEIQSFPIIHRRVVLRRAEASHYYEQRGLEACQTLRFVNSFYQKFAACLTFKVALLAAVKAKWHPLKMFGMTAQTCCHPPYLYRG